jgi:hypothetical protein
MVSVRDGKIASLLAQGRYVSNDRLENAKRAAVYHPDWRHKQLRRMLKDSGAQVLPPKPLPPDDLQRTLAKWFPGITLMSGQFEYMFTKEPPQPSLVWKFRTIRNERNNDDVVLSLEPFTGRVHTLHVLNRLP